MDPAPLRTVLFTPLGLNLAEVTRMIQVARALPRTVEPVFLVHDSGFDHLVARAGLRRVRGERPFTAREAAQVMAFDQGRTPRHPFTHELVRRRVLREREAIREVGAVAVVHGTNPTSPISARAEGVPLFYPVPYAWSAPMLRSGRPLPLVADRGLGHVVNRLLTPPVRHAATASSLLVPRSFRRAAAEAGVRLDSPMDLLGADVTLLTCMEDEVTEELPPDTHVVGPIFAHLDADVPPIVRALATADRPLVYMAFGSSGNRRLVLAAMRAIAEAPVEVVAPVRQYLRAGDEARIPDNVHVVDLLPAHLLGGLVDAALLHGGQGTVQTACATAVPFVGIGLSAEQRWNVDVCVRSGNALALTPSDVQRGGRRFQTALARVVRDPRIRAAAHDVAGRHGAVDGAVRSAEIIARTGSACSSAPRAAL